MAAKLGVMQNLFTSLTQIQVLMGLSLEIDDYCLLIILHQGVCLKLLSLMMMVIPGTRFLRWRIWREWSSHILQLSGLVMSKFMSPIRIIGRKLSTLFLGQMM